MSEDNINIDNSEDDNILDENAFNKDVSEQIIDISQIKVGDILNIEDLPYNRNGRPNKRPHKNSNENFGSSNPQRNINASNRSRRIRTASEIGTISIVIPLYNEAESLPTLAENIIKSFSKDFNLWEVIFVDDGSTDDSYEVISEICRKDCRFKCLRFRTNMGKSAALSAGFTYARGRYVGTMDADLQDDPKEFKPMLKLMNTGYDLVSGWKKKRHDPITKTIPSRFFNFVTSKCSGIKLHDFNCGIKLYKKEVIQSLEVYGEMHRYLPALAHWNGFKVTEIPVEHHKRKFGKSKFGIARFIRGFLDLLTFVFTTRYLKRPMHFFGLWGTICSIVGLIIFADLSIEWMCGTVHLSERPLAWVSLGLIVIGIQFFSVGLIGELLVKQSYSPKFKNYEIRNKILSDIPH
jgi:glycosyltransferase involved in cell wall biosynthesis